MKSLKKKNEIPNEFRLKFKYVHFFASQTPTDTFTMDEAFVHPLKVVYKYDETHLEEIELPSILNLDSILTKI